MSILILTFGRRCSRMLRLASGTHSGGPLLPADQTHSGTKNSLCLSGEIHRYAFCAYVTLYIPYSMNITVQWHSLFAHSVLPTMTSHHRAFRRSLTISTSAYLMRWWWISSRTTGKGRPTSITGSRRSGLAVSPFLSPPFTKERE